MKTISFNTKRTYTEHGQRIAAAAIDGGAFFVDVDRGISSFISNCRLNEASIMYCYDNNMGMTRTPPSIVAKNYEGYNDLRETLEKLAESQS